MQFVMVIQLVCNYDMAFFDNSQWFVQLPASSAVKIISFALFRCFIYTPGTKNAAIGTLFCNDL